MNAPQSLGVIQNSRNRYATHFRIPRLTYPFIPHSERGRGMRARNLWNATRQQRNFGGKKAEFGKRYATHFSRHYRTGSVRRRCSFLSCLFIPADRLRKTCVRWSTQLCARVLTQERALLRMRASLQVKSEIVRQFSSGRDAGTKLSCVRQNAER